MRITDIAPVAIILVITGISMGAGAMILAQMTSNVCVLNTSAITTATCNPCCGGGTYFNQTPPAVYYTFTNASESIRTLSAWLPTISLVIAAAVIIGIVFGSFILGRKGE